MGQLHAGLDHQFHLFLFAPRTHPTHTPQNYYIMKGRFLSTGVLVLALIAWFAAPTHGQIYESICRYKLPHSHPQPHTHA